jgi:hypothetical protein
MARFLAFLWLTSLLALGCSRRGGPSPDYEAANARYSHLYADRFEDAYTDPAMDGVIAQLQRVPANSSDSPAAQQLLQKIQQGRAEAKRRDDAFKKDIAVLGQPPPPGTFTADFSRPSSPAPPPAPAQDAGQDAGGPEEPASGMAVAEFQRLWGDCFTPSDPVNVVGVGLRDGWQLKDYNRCRSALPGFDQRLIVTDSKAVIGVYPLSAVRRPPPPIAPPPEPPAAPVESPDAGA